LSPYIMLFTVICLSMSALFLNLCQADDDYYEDDG